MGLIDSSWSRNDVAAFVVKARMAGYKVHELEAGYCTEIDGLQIFRATDMGNERYMVRIDERIWPDV